MRLACQAVAATTGLFRRGIVPSPIDNNNRYARESHGCRQPLCQIFEANRDLLTDPNKIQGGQKLSIP
jgi:hypothetical protein